MRLKNSLIALIFTLAGLTCVVCPPAVNAQTDQERYSVQFRLPLDKNEVWSFVEMISGLGYPSYMYTKESADGSTDYFAQMGSYPSIVDAIDAASALNKKVTVQYDVVHTNTNSVVKLGDDSGESAPAATIKEPEQPRTVDTTTKTPGNSGSANDEDGYDEPIIETPEAPAVAAAQAPSAPETPKQPEIPVIAASPAAPNAAKSVAEAAAAEQPPAEQEKIYLLQIFSFQVPNNAVQTAKNYKKKGYEPKILKLYDSQDKEWFIVSVGYAKTQKEAAALADSFAEKEGKRPTLNNVNADFLTTRIVPFED